MDGVTERVRLRAKVWRHGFRLWLYAASAYGGAFLLGYATSPAATAFAEPVAKEVRGLAAAIAKRVEITGKLIQATALRIDQPRRLTKLKQELWLTERTKLTDQLSLRSTQRAWYDAVYALSNEFSRAARSDQQWDVELRETYLDYSNGPFDVRLGKQQMVWGESVGLFFADVVNAKDLREYVLPDFDVIRMPQWAADVEFSHEPWHVEAVWIPMLAFNKLGVSGSEFAFPLPVPPGRAFNVNDPATPPNSFDNSEAGVRLSWLHNGWDVSAFVFHGWDQFPVLYRSVTPGGVYNFNPQYQRAHLLGGSFSKEIANVVLKGEFVVNPRGHFSTFDPTDSDGIVAKPVIDYLLGVDHTFGKVETGVQFMQRIIAHHADLMQDDATDTHISVWMKTSFLNGKVAPELLVLTGLAEQDLLYRPKVTWKLNDRWQVRAGADIFQGTPSGLFGRFNHKSRAWTEVSYYF